LLPVYSNCIMTSYLLVQKDGNIKQMTSKNLVEEDLYKKAGFRSESGFKCYANWPLDNANKQKYSIHVYGKTDGRANQENKYEFPPPIDNTLFFGSCLIINMNGNNPVSITLDEWKTIYEKLYGGFEDIHSEDESESESEDDVPRTKSGYAKDGFIVDDEEEEEEDGEDFDDEEDDFDDEEDDEEEETYKKHKKRPVRLVKPIIKKKIAKTRATKTVPENVFISIDGSIDCTNELCEEDYIEE